MTDERDHHDEHHNDLILLKGRIDSLERELTRLKAEDSDTYADRWAHEQEEHERTRRELTEWKDQATKNLASRDEWSIRAHDAERELTELREVVGSYHLWLERHEQLNGPGPDGRRKGYIGLDHKVGENVKGCHGCAVLARAEVVTP